MSNIRTTDPFSAKEIIGDVMVSIGVDQADDKSVDAALDAASGR